MKKCLLFSAMALLFSVTAVLGQTMGLGAAKIDVDAIKKNIESSDVAINDPKKNEKWMTWLERGDIYMEAANAPTKGLFSGLELENMSKLYQPKPVVKDPIKLKAEKGGETEYLVHEYDRFTTYFTNKKLAMWTENKIVVDSMALDKAAEAYDYAFLLDAKAMERAKKGFTEIVKIIKNKAVTHQRLGENVKAAKEYRRSYIIQQYPSNAVVDTADLFLAAANFTGSHQFKDALECLKELQRLGYDANGDTYYYLYHSYNGLEQEDSARMILLEGARKFPLVSKLYNSLPVIYAVNVNADINEIVPIMEKAFADPANTEKSRLYFGMGQAYTQRNMNDKALEYFAKAADADKEEFSYQFNTALLYLKKGDQKGRETQEQSENLPADEYKKAREEVSAIYGKAIPYLERAHKLEPKNESVVELLAGLTFRLRETDEKMMEKSKKYDELLKSMQTKTEEPAKPAEAAKPASPAKSAK